MNDSSLLSANLAPKDCDYLMVLRGLSALAVVFCHLPFELHNWFGANSLLTSFLGDKLDWIFDPFGYVPVLIFFSLSGYLITLGFFTGRHDPSSLRGLKVYYRSRALRILPLYYFSIIVCVLLYWSLASQSPWRVARLFVFIENYKPVNGIIFNHVYWTLPVEMLYFLMAPFFYLALKKMLCYLQSWVVFGVLSFVFFCLAFSIFYALPTADGAFTVPRRSWSLLARFDFIYNLMAFVLGGVGVFIVKNKNYIKVFSANRTLVKAVTCIMTVSVTAYSSTSGLTLLNNGHLSYFMAFGLIPSIALIVLGVAILNETQAGRSRPYSRYLVYLGLLSYGIYLFHMPVFDAIQKYSVTLNMQMTNEFKSLLVLCITVLLSHTTYKYIELPFLRSR